jgi:hypothetical protein
MEYNSKNIALTNGSQSAFFLLYTCFPADIVTVRSEDTPPSYTKYIGYADAGLSSAEVFFYIHQPEITFSMTICSSTALISTGLWWMIMWGQYAFRVLLIPQVML